MKPTDDSASEPIQPLTRPEDAPLIRSVEDLRQRWRSLFGTGGFMRSLWVMGLSAEGRQLPVIIPVDDLPRRIPAEDIRRLGEVLALMLPDDAAVAMALTCPWAPSHRDGFSHDDRIRAEDIQIGLEFARDQGTWPWRTWPLHLAREGTVRTFRGRTEVAA